MNGPDDSATMPGKIIEPDEGRFSVVPGLDWIGDALRDGSGPIHVQDGGSPDSRRPVTGPTGSGLPIWSPMT